MVEIVLDILIEIALCVHNANFRGTRFGLLFWVFDLRTTYVRDYDEIIFQLG